MFGSNLMLYYEIDNYRERISTFMFNYYSYDISLLSEL